MLDGKPFVLHVSNEELGVHDSRYPGRIAAVHGHRLPEIVVFCATYLPDALTSLNHANMYEGLILDVNIGPPHLYRNGEAYEDPRGMEFAKVVGEVLAREVEIVVIGRSLAEGDDVVVFLREQGFTVGQLAYDQVIEETALRPFFERVERLAEKRRKK